MTHASDPDDGNSLGDTARKAGRNRITAFTQGRKGLLIVCAGVGKFSSGFGMILRGGRAAYRRGL